MTKKVRKAIFPVAGLGTRFLPATKSVPKEMLPIAGKPLIQYAFEEARDAGIEQFIFISGRNKHAITNHFDYEYELQSVLNEREKKEALEQVVGWLPNVGDIVFLRQREPLGLGHAVWCARNIIGDEPCAVLLPDELFYDKTPLLAQMIEAYEQAEQSQSNIIAVAEVDSQHTNRYGIIDPAEKKNGLITIKNMIEKPDPKDAPSCFSIIGRYILQPEIFSYLDKGKKGAGGEIQLTDAMQELLSVQPFFGMPFSGERYDCGALLGFIDANIAYALKKGESEKEVQKIVDKYAKKDRSA